MDMKPRPRGLDGAELLAWMEAQCVPARNGCLEWCGVRTRDGYGRLKYKGRYETATRLAFTLRHGPIPEGLLLRHRCDNPPCIDDEHLLLGTPADNTEDMVVRGRSVWGAANCHARLTPEQVRAIRQDTRPTTVLGPLYGVDRTVISKIQRRLSWAHLPD